MALLEVRNLKLHYRTDRGAVRAVDGATFSVEEGQALGVVGESGSGKSSLALALLRVLPRNVQLYEGSVRMEGVDVMSLRAEEFRQTFRWKKMSMVFQGAMHALNPVLRVGHQVAEPLLIDGGMPKSQAYERVHELMEKVGLASEVFQRYPHELSGGMKQRVVTAMALVQYPKLVVLDEPTSALDVSIQAQITNLLKQLKQALGLSFIFITHDIALASDVCDQLAVIYGGQVVELGSIEEVLANPQHPYTEKLLASLPRLQSDAPPEFIPGQPPDLVNPPEGCRFHPRCPYAFEPCAHRQPAYFATGLGHWSRCWLREGEEAGGPASSLG